MEKKDGYTWTRQSCQSRLDYIFVSQYLTTRINRVEVNYSFEQSDQAGIFVKMHINEDIVTGLGLTKVNSSVLNNPVNLLAVTSELRELLTQFPPEWDPHKRLDYLKMSLRTTISEAVGRDRNELKKSIM